MLDDRKTAILSAIVQEYIATAQPVGSGHVVGAPGVTVSSATVRNEMAVLEQEGYLAQPHTSAGRIPTDKGYRFFVDHLASPQLGDQALTQEVGAFFSAAHGRLEELLHQTSNLLAGLTHNAAVVVGPKAASATVRSVQLVELSDAQATVVVVLSNGSVESATIELDRERRINAGAVSAHLTSVCAGQTLSTLGGLRPSGDDAFDALCAAALDAVRVEASTDQVYTGGASAVAESFDAVDVVRSVLQTLEQQYVVVSLITDIVSRGMSVAIGGEHGVEPLSACAVVVAPVLADGEQVGTVGLLGPTRMNYPQALATVDVVSEQLGRRIEES